MIQRDADPEMENGRGTGGFRIFLLAFLVMGVMVAGVVAYAFDQAVKKHLTKISQSGEAIIAQQGIIIDDALDSIQRDVLFLSQLENLKRYVNSGQESALNAASQDFLAFADTHSSMYDHVRFIDEDGMERIRIATLGGACIVRRSDQNDELPDACFLNTMKLHQGSVYVAPQQAGSSGKALQSVLPMLSVATPVFDNIGEKQGVVALNYLLNAMFARMTSGEVVAVGATLLLNTQGAWLLGPEHAAPWSGLFPRRDTDSFAKERPGEWQAIASADQGQLSTDLGVLTFTTIRPQGIERLATADRDNTFVEVDDSFWKLVSLIPRSAIEPELAGIRVQFLAMGAVLLLFAATVSWQTARLITRRREYNRKLRSMALHDALTGLPNRRLFMERFDAALESAQRYQRRLAVLYIDLDGFKHVNDTLGHEAGDRLLQEVARLFTACCRKSDTLARLGGDEFAVILSEVSDAHGAGQAAAKLLASLAEPIALGEKLAGVGASIGVALYPDHATDIDGLLRAADEAMYRSKQTRTNMVSFAESVPAQADQSTQTGQPEQSEPPAPASQD